MREEPSVPHETTSLEDMQEKYTAVHKVAFYMEKMRLGEYIQNMNSPWRIIWTNLLAGISRGVGLTVGATVVIAILFKILAALIAMQIPYLTDVLQEFVQTINPQASFVKPQIEESADEAHIERAEVGFEERNLK